MKKLIALMLALVMLLCFAACGGEKADKGDKNSEDPVEITGETFDAGNFTVLVPTDWKAFPVADMWSDEENAVDPDQVNVVKGGESEFDTLTKPVIQIVHYEPDSMINPSPDFYDDVTTVDAFKAGELSWEGFSTVDFSGNAMTLIWTTNAAGHGFQATLFANSEDAKIAVTDADVLAVLGSVANK